MTPHTYVAVIVVLAAALAGSIGDALRNWRRAEAAEHDNDILRDSIARRDANLAERDKAITSNADALARAAIRIHALERQVFEMSRH